ncbi:MAG: C10 family peptidase, partial [Bacteroidota bacterium]
MEIRKFIPVWVAILLLPMMVWSKGVSFSAARQVALNFCTSSGHPAGIAGSGDTTAYAALPQPGQVGPIPLYYRFLLSDGNGFVLVAADDRIPPILGYSFGPYLESESIPPAYSGFMMELERQITGIIKGSSIPGIETQRQWSSLSSPAAGTALPVRDLQPLIATNWNQGCFYNAGSPNDTAAKTSCLHALSGSGAVAMAQVMKFYNYPAHGSGEHGYVHPKYGIQYANFGATNYNYTLIPDTVSAPNDMAATLIYQCGVAQNMNFGVAGSTSDSSAVDTALVKYFSYPGTAAWKWKAGYTPGEWLSMIKSELDASHPLIYHGNSVGTGDSYFICDGYQGADFFHFNWGWGGAFDGYYYLDNLSPGSNNFASAQGAIFNLAPAAPVPDSYTMDFEAVPDFSLTFNNWTVNDVEKHTTYGIANHTFTHQYEPMAFLSFNPAQVTPSMASDAAIQPHGGVRFGACFNSNPPQNDDWFVSPQIQLGVNGSFSFWVKSYNDLYGLDTYTVAVSATDNNPGSFAVISGSQPLQTTLAWTKKTFSLSAYDNHKVYVAIHCNSNDHFLMMIDDLVVKTHGSTLLTAGFSASGTTVMAGDSINFLDQSVGVPTSWEWSFPGAIPAASVLQNPSGIRYPVPGIYPVKLK